jgi:hypothetical protein
MDDRCFDPLDAERIHTNAEHFDTIAEQLFLVLHRISGKAARMFRSRQLIKQPLPMIPR